MVTERDADVENYVETPAELSDSKPGGQQIFGIKFKNNFAFQHT